MSRIDEKYQELVHKVYRRGFEYEDPNRKGVIRKQIPYHTFEHSFAEGFPIIGLKQSYPKMAFNEMKAFMMGKTNLKDLEDLGVTFWRKDAYNYYIKKCKEYDDEPWIDFDTFLKLLENDSQKRHPYFLDYELGDLGKIYSHQIRNWNDDVDQLNQVLERLKKNPMSTKNIVTMWNPSDLNSCALSPCHTRFSFVVTKLDESSYGLTIQWNQDSVDLFLGLPINIMYYSFICYVFAKYLGMIPIGIVGNLTNVHLYDNSFSAVEKLLERDPLETERVRISTQFGLYYSNLDSFLKQLSFSDFEIYDYNHLGRLDVEMLPYTV
jgi:thymidylate synthase